MSATERTSAQPGGPQEKAPYRSMDITIKNVTDLTWSFKSADLKHGIWHQMGNVDWRPPATIAQYSRGHFNSESSGFGTGCEGYVTYGSSAGDLVIHFDDPGAGSNEFSARPPAGYDEIHGDISGNTAAITTSITPHV